MTKFTTALISTASALLFAGAAFAQSSPELTAQLNDACQAAYDPAQISESRDTHNAMCGCLAREAESNLNDGQTELLIFAVQQDAEQAQTRLEAMGEDGIVAFFTAVEQITQTCDREFAN